MGKNNKEVEPLIDTDVEGIRRKVAGKREGS